MNLKMTLIYELFKKVRSTISCGSVIVLLGLNSDEVDKKVKQFGRFFPMYSTSTKASDDAYTLNFGLIIRILKKRCGNPIYSPPT